MNDIAYYFFRNIQDWILRHRRIVIVFTILVVILISAYSAWTFISRQGKVPVEIATFPHNAKISVEGAGDLARGVHYLPPGNYKYQVSADGYKSVEDTLTVTDKNPSNIYRVLVKDQVGKKTFTREETVQIQEIEGKSGEASREFTENFENNYPIVKLLPIKDPYYSIGYLSDGKGGGFYLTVYTESPRYRSNALKRIQGLGVNLYDYKIVFQDYKNPLTEAKQ
ncbi:PEGA domain-containing protein [Candidatus Saccharibacteria bacterium]|nr:PEGA domain-containing protein [Candidatus Saccharibacteria bacterium]MBH2007663.1 PEGA domain-containing protein [Candidatus Saccharibacteria bacterium]